jgi:hypothetical protein
VGTKVGVSVSVFKRVSGCGQVGKWVRSSGGVGMGSTEIGVFK